MKGFFKALLVLGLLGVIGYAVYKVVSGLLGQSSGAGTGETVASPGPLMGGDDGLTINEADLGGDVAPDLLEILVDPTDKQPLELVDGKWLVNRRTGRRYPIVTGIPIMLPEVGEKYRDPSLASAGQNGA